MKAYLGQLKACLTQRSLDLGDHESVLSLLYEAYSDINPMPDPQIKADFQRLYEQMNGMSLREMDQFIDPVCSLCRHHECSGFVHGVQVGIVLAGEINVNTW